MVSGEVTQLLALMQNDTSHARELADLVNSLPMLTKITRAAFGSSGPSDVAPVIRDWANVTGKLNRIKEKSTATFVANEKERIATVDAKLTEAIADLFEVEGEIFIAAVLEPLEKVCTTLETGDQIMDGKVGNHLPLASMDDYLSPEALALRQSWLDSISKQHAKNFHGLLKSGVLNREKAGFASLSNTDVHKTHVTIVKARIAFLESFTANIRPLFRMLLTHRGEPMPQIIVVEKAVQLLNEPALKQHRTSLANNSDDDKTYVKHLEAIGRYLSTWAISKHSDLLTTNAPITSDFFTKWIDNGCGSDEFNLFIDGSAEDPAQLVAPTAFVTQYMSFLGGPEQAVCLGGDKSLNLVCCCMLPGLMSIGHHMQALKACSMSDLGEEVWQDHRNRVVPMIVAIDAAIKQFEKDTTTRLKALLVAHSSSNQTFADLSQSALDSIVVYAKAYYGKVVHDLVNKVLKHFQSEGEALSELAAMHLHFMPNMEPWPPSRSNLWSMTQSAEGMEYNCRFRALEAIEDLLKTLKSCLSDRAGYDKCAFQAFVDLWTPKWDALRTKTAECMMVQAACRDSLPENLSRGSLVEAVKQAVAKSYPSPDGIFFDFMDCATICDETPSLAGVLPQRPSGKAAAPSAGPVALAHPISHAPPSASVIPSPPVTPEADDSKQGSAVDAAMSPAPLSPRKLELSDEADPKKQKVD